MEKQKPNTREFIGDMPTGMDCEAVMLTYEIPPELTLEGMFQKQADKGDGKREEIDAQVGPYLCPACGGSQEEDFDVCPRCGVAAAMYIAEQVKEAKQKKFHMYKQKTLLLFSKVKKPFLDMGPLGSGAVMGMGALSGILIGFGLTIGFASPETGRLDWPLAVVTFLCGWGASLFVLLRGVNSLSRLMMRGSLLGAVEWIVMIPLGISFAKRVMEKAAGYHGTDTAAARAIMDGEIFNMITSGLAVFMAAICLVCLAVSYFVWREMEPELDHDTIRCPFCAEIIRLDARVCRFCGRDLLQIAPA
jgi:hypothetical protein